MVGCVQLQNVLQIVIMWSILRQLTLNICKCIVQHASRGNPQYRYHLNNIALESRGSVKDLGVTISKDFTYHPHIIEIITIFITNTCFLFGNIRIIKKNICYLYQKFTNSLEYGSILWNPWSIHEIERVENIHHKLMSLAYKYHENYDVDRPSLKRQREEIDLKLYHTILDGKTRIQPLQSKFHNSKTCKHL